MAVRKPLVLVNGVLQELSASDDIGLDALPIGTGPIPMAVGSTQSGWLVGDGTTIGSAASGATQRANADVQDLFNLWWATYSDAVCPLQTSAGAASTRGASAAADWAANKRMVVFDVRGRFARFTGTINTLTFVAGTKYADSFKAHDHGIAGPNVFATGGTAEYGPSGGRNKVSENVGGAETAPVSIAFNGYFKYARAAAGSAAAETSAPSFAARKSSNQTFTTSPALITWQTALWNVGNYFNTATGRFTPLVPGRYQVNFRVYGQVARSTTVDMIPYLQKNGANYAAANAAEFASAWEGVMTGSCIVPMNGTTDYLTMVLASSPGDSGSTTIVAADEFTAWEAIRLGPL